MRKLALDLGTKTCGFALSDENGIIASNLKTIQFDEQDFAVVISEISGLLKIYEIDALILGYPLRSNGAKSERTEMVEQFAKDLQKSFSLKVYLVNEYGTTIKATSILKSAKMSIKKRKKHKDTLSATLILQDFLEYGGKEFGNEPT
ncbi:Holliday junction resolvase RuvX [Mycoplasmopsis columbinasalis]|uniref:Putative pre-16S rRNA nuclease n=1 Tax=Mycoplasmopsis columbinasalis TaxID=114880 RepID=A0A449BA67_9BACT|nr:Holliday junction resolvase RuvX [Mycoplasmopsis columbinasalis]VEU78090.1 Holliday junction resolvase [Mycoplasmopsis columbinasalis]